MQKLLLQKQAAVQSDTVKTANAFRHFRLAGWTALFQ